MSGWVSSTGLNINLAAPGPIGGTTPSSGAFTTISATTSVTSPITKASSSAGGTLQSSNGTDCLQWGAGGGSNVTINAGISVIGNIVMSTSGNGIDFSATPGTGTSELFNDYEEGTWTATLKGSVSDPTTPVIATGRYTKIGRLVIISVSFDGVDTTGAIGNVTVTGLPYNNSTPYTRVSGVVGYLGNFPIVNKYVACGMDENATEVYFNDISGIGYGAALQHSAGAGRYLRFEITYYAS